MEPPCLTPFTILQFLWNREVSFGCELQLLSLDAPASFTFWMYLQIFLTTCVLESPFYLGYARWKKKPWWLAISLLFLANLATHPAVVFLVPRLAARYRWHAYASVLIQETFAPLLEALIAKKMLRIGWIAALALAFSANLFSWWVGEWLTYCGF